MEPLYPPSFSSLDRSSHCLRTTPSWSTEHQSLSECKTITLCFLSRTHSLFCSTPLPQSREREERCKSYLATSLPLLPPSLSSPSSHSSPIYPSSLSQSPLSPDVLTMWLMVTMVRQPCCASCVVRCCALIRTVACTTWRGRSTRLAASHCVLVDSLNIHKRMSCLT